MTPGEFAAKWRGVTTGERASAQSHFGDLCRMLGEPTPTDADPTGSWYAFEEGAETRGRQMPVVLAMPGPVQVLSAAVLLPHRRGLADQVDLDTRHGLEDALGERRPAETL